MVVNVKKKVETTRHNKGNDKSKKYILLRERNVGYHNGILSERQHSFQLVYKKAYEVSHKGLKNKKNKTHRHVH